MRLQHIKLSGGIKLGCDIHLYTEKRNALGQWELVKGKNPRIDDYRGYAVTWRERGDTEKAEDYDNRADKIESGVMQTEEVAKYGEEAGDYYAPLTTDWVYTGRNYDLFAILADVRNGRGFAGVVTGEGFNPIDDPRGVPEDASAYVKEECERWDGDGHSHSYMTLRDLKEYDWDQVTTHSGVVGEDEFKVWKLTGKPNGWSGGVSGGSVTHLSVEEMNDLLRGKYPRKADKSYYTEVSWVEAYHESVGYFYDKSIPALEELAGGDPDSVRIVFWFDN
jgi:hypothetical protein